MLVGHKRKASRDNNERPGFDRLGHSSNRETPGHESSGFYCHVLRISMPEAAYVRDCRIVSFLVLLEF